MRAFGTLKGLVRGTSEGFDAWYSETPLLRGTLKGLVRGTLKGFGACVVL